MPCNFYAILNDGSIRKINLTQPIIPSIKNVFINSGNLLLNDEIEEIEFDGNYVIQEGEILFVTMALPNNVIEVTTNAIGITDLNLETDKIKTLFWYENQVYYFQNFDNRKLLKNRNVIFYNNQTYSKLVDNAFIVENIVNAIYKNGNFYFNSYVNANKIFSLIEFYQDATDEEINTFSTNIKVSMDLKWFIDNSNSVIRKQITLLQKSNILATANTKKIKSTAKKFNLGIDLDPTGKIIFPNDKRASKDILTFLNEDYWIGLISGNKYKTNSKRSA